MEVAHADARTRAVGLGAFTLVLQGYIHERNWASMRMAERARWEPDGLPLANGYQLWARVLDPREG
jgi:hypothetical protein